MLEYTKNHPKFTQLYMVCKSVAKEAIRYALQTVEVTEKHIVATDGRRMACLDNFGIEVGRYKPIKVSKSCVTLVKVEAEGNFPDYEAVLPKERSDFEKLARVESENISLQHYRIAKAGKCIIIDFLADYMMAGWWVIGRDDASPVEFYSDGFRAAIMPITGDA